MGVRQKTIKKEVSISGIGLHTGVKVNVRFVPGEVDSGINFVRVDLPNKPVIQAIPSNLLESAGIPRCTSLTSNGAVIHTVEHLMSVLCGLGITNLVVECDAEELPALDGSGIDFFNILKQAGILEQNKEVSFFKVTTHIGVEENGSLIYIVPSDDFRVSYTLDYDNPCLGSQFFSLVVTPENFQQHIVSCRTFCLEDEVEELRSKGLGKGATYTNTLVVGKDGVKENTLRFPDEFARHKILDLIGDFYLLGIPVKGHVIAVKSGHDLNMKLLKKIARHQQQVSSYDKRLQEINQAIDNKKEIDIIGIMKILPHRYPFLLIDRVVDLDKGKRAVAIKNVTANEDFFQGHFPSRPVMPGVLMVEAMAQTAGILILSNEVHRGKIAFFMAVDKVKFRKVVSPGDQLIIEANIMRDKTRTAQVSAKASVDGNVVAEAEMMFSFTDASYLGGDIGS